MTLDNQTVADDRVMDQTLSSIGLLSFGENLYLFIILQRCKRLPLQIKLLILSITVSDSVLGANCFLLYCRPLTDYFLRKDMLCWIRQSVFWTTVMASIFLMTLLSLDRCLSLTLVMKYQSRIDVWITSLVLVIVWTLAIIFGISKSADVNFVGNCVQTDGWSTHIMYSGIAALCFSIILSSFFVICCILKRYGPSVISITDLMKESHHIVAAEVRAVVRMHLITIVFLLCYIPGMVCTSVPDVLPDLGNKYPSVVTSLKSMKVLFLINGILNPFLYVWRFKECSINARLLLPSWGDWCRSLHEEATRERVYLYASYLESPTTSSSYIRAPENGESVIQSTMTSMDI